MQIVVKDDVTKGIIGEALIDLSRQAAGGRLRVLTLSLRCGCDPRPRSAVPHRITHRAFPLPARGPMTAV